MVMIGDLPLLHTMKLLIRTTTMMVVIGAFPLLLLNQSTTVMVMGTVTVTSTLLFLLDLNTDRPRGTRMKKMSKMMVSFLHHLAILRMERMWHGLVSCESFSFSSSSSLFLPCSLPFLSNHHLPFPFFTVVLCCPIIAISSPSFKHIRADD